MSFQTSGLFHTFLWDFKGYQWDASLSKRKPHWEFVIICLVELCLDHTCPYSFKVVP